MRERSLFLALPALTLLLVTALPAAAEGEPELWRWYDGAGGAHLSRSRDAVPEEFKATAEPVRESGVDPASALPPAMTRTVPAPPGPPSERQREAAEPRVDRDGHDEAWWRNRVLEIKKEIADTKTRIEELTTQRKREPLIRKERARRKELAEARETVTELERQLAEDLPKEARAAGAPQSWLR